MTSGDYTLAADWSRNGGYTGTLEDVTSKVPPDTPITVEWGRGVPRADQDTAAGKMSFELVNIDRQFSPENTSSPIAGKVLPGTPAQLLLDVGTTSSVLVKLFEGPIDTLAVDPNADARTFAAECSDGWSTPGSQQLSTPVYQGQRTGDLIGAVLDAIGWPAANRSLDPGATVIPYWWAEGVDASTAINDLVRSEGPPAVWWVQGGVFYFRDRHHRILDAGSNTSQGEYTHTIPAGPLNNGEFKILRGSFGYDHGLNNIVNTVSLAIAPRIPGQRGFVWRDEDPIVLTANEVRQFIVQSETGFVDAQTPAPFVYNTDGNPITGQYHIASGSLASISLSRTSGAACIMTVTAGGSGAYLDLGMALTATPIIEKPAVQVTEFDPSSVGIFGRQSWDGTLPWAGVYDAQAIADRVVSTFATPHPSVTLAIAGIDSAHIQQMGYRTISDRITVRNDELGLDRDFIVERVRHTITALNPLLHQMELGCQVPDAVQPATVFTFDLAGSGFNQGAFAINGIDNPGTMFLFDTAGQGFGQGLFAN